MSDVKENGTKRITCFSRIRVIAGIAIVILHTFTMYGMAFRDIISEGESYVTGTVPYLMMWAVPCFVMVTGALLLDEGRSLSIGRLLGRYVLRVILVLLIFITLFFFLDLWMNKESFSMDDFSTIWHKFMENGSWAHLWYLYLLVGLYLLMPAYRLIAKHASRETLIYLGIVLFLFLSVLPAVTKMTAFSTAFYICTSSIFPLYLFLGRMIHKGQLSIGFFTGILFFAAGVAVTIFLTRLDMGDKQSVVEGLLGNYAFPSVVLMSVGAFSALRGIGGGESGPTMQKVWQFLDRYSFGIYLVHLIYLRFLIKVVKWNPFATGSFWMLIPVVLLVYGLSLATAIVLKLIPGLKRLL